MIAYSLSKNKARVNTVSIHFLIALFYINSFLLFMRALVAVSSAPLLKTLTPVPLQTITFTVPFIMTFVCTFCFILMINKRMGKEIDEAREHFEHIFSLSPDAH